MKWSFYSLVVLWGCLLSAKVGAQELFFRPHPLGDGLEDIHPQLIFEQRNGYIWLGGEGGLLRYDGHAYRHWLTADSLSSNTVTSIYEDKEGTLWIGYSNGSIFKLIHGDKLVPWVIEEGWPVVAITGFVEDEAHNLWIATYGEGLYCYRNKHLYNFDVNDGLPAQDIYALALDACGRVLVGTDGGLSHCSWLGNKKRIKTLTHIDGLPDDIIRAIVPDALGNTWVGAYDGGIARVDDALECVEVMPHWPGGIVRSMAILAPNNLWVGTDGSGLYQLDIQSGQWEKDPYIGRSKVYSLLTDAEANLWAITHDKGLLSAQCRFAFAHTPMANLQTISIDQQGGRWLGDQTGLFYAALGATEYQAIKPLAGQNIVSSYLDEYGLLWVGTFGNGLFGVDTQTGQVRHFCQGQGLEGGSILSIAGQKNTLWMATLGGVYTLSYGPDALQGGSYRCALFEVEDGIGQDFIYQVFVDRDHRIWFGLDGKGVACWDGHRLEWFKQAGEVEIRRVYSIAQDGLGHIWINTADNGVFQAQSDHSFAPVSPFLGGKNQQIASLIADGAGNMLVIHDSGISLWDPFTQHWIFYDDSVGILPFEPSLNAVLKDPAGYVWAVGKDKVVRVAPLALRNDREDPRTLLEGVSIYLSPTPFWEKNIFQHDENNLVFQFVGLWYTDPDAVRYRFQLEGFDLDWIETADRNATYSNLPPGSYTFKVAAMIAPQFHPMDAALYTFEIKSPLWRRAWFVLLMVLMTTTAILLLIRQRENRLKREAGLRKENIESQYETLKSQINPHFLFNSFNTLAGLIEENPTNAVTYIEKLADFYRSILIYREKEVISLAEELKLIDDYFYLLRERYGNYVQLSVNVPERLQGLVAPMALQMLVENAIKHNVITRDRPLRIEISTDADGRYLSVCNNLQPKLAPERSTGFGLQSIIKRYALLSTQAVVIEANHEDCFCVRLPIIASRPATGGGHLQQIFRSKDSTSS